MTSSGCNHPFNPPAAVAVVPCVGALQHMHQQPVQAAFAMSCGLCLDVTVVLGECKLAGCLIEVDKGMCR